MTLTGRSVRGAYVGTEGRSQRSGDRRGRSPDSFSTWTRSRSEGLPRTLYDPLQATMVQKIEDLSPTRESTIPVKAGCISTILQTSLIQMRGISALESVAQRYLKEPKKKSLSLSARTVFLSLPFPTAFFIFRYQGSIRAISSPRSRSNSPLQTLHARLAKFPLLSSSYQRC